MAVMQDGIALDKFTETKKTSDTSAKLRRDTTANGEGAANGHSFFDGMRARASGMFSRGEAAASKTQIVPAGRRRDRYSKEDYFVPTADLISSDDAFHIVVELSGVDENYVGIKISEGYLTISGVKEETEDESDKDYQLKECRYGYFLRRFALPKNVDIAAIEATFDKCQLNVTMPKKPMARFWARFLSKARRIWIRKPAG